MNKIFLLSIVFFALACKNEKKADGNIEKTEATIENDFSVSFNLIALKDDNFHLYYTEDGSINFNEEKSMWYPFKGSATDQEVKFKLPKDVIPTNLRFDLGYGVNKEQLKIVLKKFKMNYYGKIFEVNDSLIYNYFYPNKENTVLDKSSSTLSRVKSDSGSAPSLYPQITLSNEINKLVK